MSRLLSPDERYALRRYFELAQKLSALVEVRSHLHWIYVTYQRVSGTQSVDVAKLEVRCKGCTGYEKWLSRRIVKAINEMVDLRAIVENRMPELLDDLDKIGSHFAMSGFASMLKIEQDGKTISLYPPILKHGIVATPSGFPPSWWESLNV